VTVSDVWPSPLLTFLMCTPALSSFLPNQSGMMLLMWTPVLRRVEVNECSLVLPKLSSDGFSDPDSPACSTGVLSIDLARVHAYYFLASGYTLRTLGTDNFPLRHFD